MLNSFQEINGVSRPSRGAPLGPQAESIPRPLTASAAEYPRLFSLLDSPPPEPLQQAACERHRSIVSEAKQAVAFALNNGRMVHTDILNDIVADALKKYCADTHHPRVTLVKMDDKLRSGPDRSYTFGQVTNRGEECFGGFWRALSSVAPYVAPTQYVTAFQIRAVPEVVRIISEVDIPSVVDGTIRSRAARSWEHQVPRESALGDWLIQLFGSEKLGFFEKFRPLGVFADAVRRVAEQEQITNILLPRSRRDPGTKPWHIGAFMRFDEGRFVWTGWGLNRGDKPVLLTVAVRPCCEILRLIPVKPSILQPRPGQAV